jgi:rhodanese-related sulfurtransferase
MDRTRMDAPPAGAGGGIKTAARMLALIGVSLVLGAAVNLARPHPLPWIEDWSHRVETQALELGLRTANAAQAREMAEGGIYFVFDARPVEQFMEGHLPGAMSLPSDAYDERILEYAVMLIPEQEILVYCSGRVCDESLQVCKNLLGQGYTNLVLFAEGMEAWQAAGYPVEEGL